MNEKIAALKKAEEMAALEVLRRGLRGMRADITYAALVDIYFARFIAEGGAA